MQKDKQKLIKKLYLSHKKFTREQTCTTVKNGVGLRLWTTQSLCWGWAGGTCSMLPMSGNIIMVNVRNSGQDMGRKGGASSKFMCHIANMFCLGSDLWTGRTHPAPGSGWGTSKVYQDPPRYRGERGEMPWPMHTHMQGTVHLGGPGEVLNRSFFSLFPSLPSITPLSQNITTS